VKRTAKRLLPSKPSPSHIYRCFMKKLNYPNRPLRTKRTVNTETENTIPFGGAHAPAQGITTRDDIGRQRFELVLMATDQPDDPFGVRRLRMALKVLHRRFGLRCVTAKVSPPREDNQ
jgi:hypothetical protein